MGGVTTGVPAERLQAGERFSVGFAPVERELSRKVGDWLTAWVSSTYVTSYRNIW